MNDQPCNLSTYSPPGPSLKLSPVNAQPRSSRNGAA